VIAAFVQVLYHIRCGFIIVAMNDEPRFPKLLLNTCAEPTHDFHAAISAERIDVNLTSQVMIQVHLIPLFGQPGYALLRGQYPHGVRVTAKKDDGSLGVIVEK
jgi:hypothetical protein